MRGLIGVLVWAGIGTLTLSGCIGLHQDPFQHGGKKVQALGILPLPGNEPVFGTSGEQGVVRLTLTDFPLGASDVRRIIVRVREIQVNQPGVGWQTPVVFTPYKEIDLLSLVNGRTMELGAFNATAGNYDRLRIVLERGGSVVTVKDGVTSTHPLTMPTDNETQILILQAFLVARTTVTTMKLDLDAAKSLTMENGKYVFRPVMRVLETRNDAGASALIDADAGGKITVPGSVSLDVPAGVLADDARITIATIAVPSFRPITSDVLIGPILDFGPDGMTFSEDVTIEVPYKRADLEAAGVLESLIRLTYYKAEEQRWVDVPATIDTDRQVLIAKVNHFTDFGITGPVGASPRINPADIVNIQDSGANPTQVPWKVAATITDASGISSAKLYFRRVGDPFYQVTTMANVGADNFEGVIPLAYIRNLTQAAGIEVFVEATDNTSTKSYAPGYMDGHLHTYNPDMDNDGMNDRWEAESLLNVAVNDAGSDNDGDGMTNIMEFILGMNPSLVDVAQWGTSLWGGGSTRWAP